MTSGLRALAFTWNYFNSHPREGGDQHVHDVQFLDLISIPTPARGVTGGAGFPPPRHCHFNSHPREGGDDLRFEIPLPAIPASKSCMTVIGAVIG